jgi:hypothetical protein
MAKTRDHDPDAEPERKPPPPGADPGCDWWHQAIEDAPDGRDKE